MMAAVGLLLALSSIQILVAARSESQAPLEDLSRLFQVDLPSADIAILLDASLRSDSNYEGLLITHEYNHIRITEGFESLVSVLAAASETILPEAISILKSFVDASQRREHWYAFLNCLKVTGVHLKNLPQPHQWRLSTIFEATINCAQVPERPSPCIIT
jgi:hypothetical protein